MTEPYVCGTGTWNGPKPGDPDLNNSILTATPAFGGIDVAWSYPALNPAAVAHTLLWRGVNSNYATSIQRAVVSGNSFYDKSPDGQTYFYWIQIVSVNGTVGELIGPASATALGLSTDISDNLAGLINDGFLAASLRAELDNLSMVNSNLANEIFDLEGTQTSWAQALQDVADGVADAHTFITTEINSRITANTAIAEQMNLIAVTLGEDVAAVVVRSDAWIGPHSLLDGKVSDIGAMWTAQVTVNNLVGGFGVYNNGQTVEAGFDVDTFWIGRTQGNKRKPFVIQGGVTYIDNAMINQLTADKIDTRGLTIKDASGNILFGSGTNLNWGLITGAAKPADNATKNTIYRQATAPTGATTNDVWFNTTSGATHSWSGSAWIKTGDVTANNTAANITGQGALATRSSVDIGTHVWLPNFGYMGTDDFVNKLSKINNTTISNFMDNAAIGTAYIGNAAITNAKIGGQIASNNWDGSQGWSIDKSGTAYFNRISIYGVIYGSVFVPNNGTATVTHNAGRYIAVSLWSAAGNVAMTLLDGTSFTVRLDNSPGGTVYYAYV